MRFVQKTPNKISLIAYLIANGITIPHYCYHNNLFIAGNCRVCLIELKGSIKPVVSCATNVNSVIFIYNNKTHYTKNNSFFVLTQLLNKILRFIKKNGTRK